jgi:CspA family cold shock protein
MARVSSEDVTWIEPLLKDLEAGVRQEAWAIVAEIIESERHRRSLAIDRVAQALDASLAKLTGTGGSTPESPATAPNHQPSAPPRNRARRSAPVLPRDGEDARAIEPHGRLSRVTHEVARPLTNASAASRASTETQSRFVTRLVPREESLLPPSRAAHGALVDPTSPEDHATSPRAADRIVRARARRAAADESAQPERQTVAGSPFTHGDASAEPRRATGVVKRFDAGRGFGFILAPDGGRDYFVHVKDVVSDDRSLTQGATVSYVPREGNRGRFAVDVRPMSPTR